MSATADPFLFAAEAFEVKGPARFLHDPVGFWHTYSNVALTEYQEFSLSKLCGQRRLAVRAPHGTGKTALSGMALVWFMVTREAARVDWKAIITAGAWRQVSQFTMPESRRWLRHLDWEAMGMREPRPGREILELSYKFEHGTAFAAASTDPQLLEGAHADSLFFIYDESKAIKATVFDATEGAFSGARPIGFPEAFALAISTPGAPSGRFYEIHNRRPGLEDWATQHITLTEAIKAGRIAPEWADRRARQWGAESALYANRVLGEFHSGSEDSVLPLAWVEAAVERWYEWHSNGRRPNVGRAVYGVDVARGGADLTCVARRVGAVVEDLLTYNVADTAILANTVNTMMRHQGDHAVVDIIGVGAGVGDILAQTLDNHGYQRSVTRYNAGRRSHRRDRSGELGFGNQRAALWWYMRESLDPAFGPTLAIPDDDELLAELTAPIWWVTPGNAIMIESKDDLRERLGRSTDRADAVLQTLATDSEWDEAGNSGGSIHVPYSDAEPSEHDPDDLPTISWEMSA